MKIVIININDLTPYENNAKQHPAEQIEQIKKSIQEYGNNDPIGVWGDKNIIVEGHGRYMALKELGYTEVECIRLDHLTDEERKAYTLVHNKTTMNSDFDFEILEQELKALKDFDIDMSKYGFDELEEQLEEKELIEDEAPAVDEDGEPLTKLGDVWVLDKHRLICGDSTDAGVIKKLMQDAKADMVYTDPPYGMGLNTDFSTMKNNLDFAKEKGFIGGKKYEQGIVDEFTPQLITTIFDNFNYCKEVFLWGADYYAELIPNKNNGSWVVWDKRLDDSADKMYGSCFELCWSKEKHKRDIARIKWAGVFGTEQEFDKKRYHPTQKPLKLSSWFLSRYSKENNLIVDLYGGSGSTLIACEQLNRCCYMVELDPRYCDVIVKRWETLTGKKAVKI